MRGTRERRRGPRSVSASITSLLAELVRVPTRRSPPRYAVAAAVAAALLAPSRSEAGQVPTYAELPVGSITSPVTGASPTAIPKGASVPGIVITRGSSSHVDVTASDAPSPQDEPRTLPGGMWTCFSQNPHARSQAEPLSGMIAAGRHLQEWEGALAPQASVWRAPHGPAVTELHAERVIERDGTALLESMDIWVDVSTLGARLVARAVLPLRQVGSAPGVKLFAGRDERRDGKRFVQLIVLRSSEPSARHLGGISGTRGDVFLPTSTCSHGRVALLPDKPGESASLELTTTLPPLPPGELPLVPPPPPQPLPSGARVEELRLRPLRIHVSVSQTTRDKEPVFAVSSAWAAPELVQRVVAPTPSKHAASSKGAATDPGF